VFPGGLVDPGDRQHGALAFERAALRECFEECGILLARDAAGNWPQLDEAARAQLAGLRSQVASGAIAIEAVCARFGLRPADETLHFISHWLTPMGRAKRFDTRFFVTAVPHGQEALQDARETLDHVWITPAEALLPGHARRLMTPTRATIESLLPFGSIDALEAWAALPRSVERILPRLGLDASGVRPVQPHEPAYDEIAKLDPHGRSDVWCELRPGVEVKLGARVTRIVREDGSNRYLVDGVEVAAPAPVLVAEDRIVIASDEGSVPADMREHAEWIAPLRGFLRALGPKPAG
jgi:8-oxo-dGTP pyrophosphatase MutT (NUDIX family)